MKLLFSTVIFSFRNRKLDIWTKCKDIHLSVPVPPKEGFEVSALKSIAFTPNATLNQLPVTRVSISRISDAHHSDIIYRMFFPYSKGGLKPHFFQKGWQAFVQ